MITVRVFRDTGDREAPNIVDEMINTESMAIARGTRFLNDPSQGAYYRSVLRTFRTIHLGGQIVPGKWVLINDDRLGLKDKKVKILSYDLEIQKDGVFVSVSTTEYVKDE
jgi:hypothetical protein